MADQNQSTALAEGRRIYLGNLLYTVRPNEIEEVLASSGFDNFEHIHISIDPISGRNPGYCFVDFTNKETAERALTELSAMVAGRELKVGPCEPKRPREWARSKEQPSSPSSSNNFQRWGDWNKSDRSYNRGQDQGPRAALEHFEEIAERSEGRRLWVGGLPRMADQDQNQAEISQYFASFNPSAIGKRITPRDITRTGAEFSHYVFVDFATRDEAIEAMNAVNGLEIQEGNKLKVAIAGQTPSKLMGRENSGEGQSPRRNADRQWRAADSNERPNRNFDNGDKRQERGSENSRGFASRDWRRKE